MNRGFQMTQWCNHYVINKKASNLFKKGTEIHKRWKSINISGATSLWEHLKVAPLDGNHATAHAFEKDTSSQKVNLGRGVYKDDNGKSWVLPSIKKAETLLRDRTSPTQHDYLPFNGLSEFTRRSAEFAFGVESPVIKEKKVATVQTISGTGALRVGAEFLSRFKRSEYPSVVLLPNPSYVNHQPIFSNAGFDIQFYRYYDKNTKGLDLEGMCQDIKNAPKGAVILLHACAHNPTGVDPSQDQWKILSQVVKESGHIAFFDCAYQGFASGDPDRDAFSFRHFVSSGHQIILAQSYSKSFGLYGQRVGALNIVTNSAEETNAVMSQLNQVIRPMYSNPPIYGALLVSTILNNPELLQEWAADVREMSHRIQGSRKELVTLLKGLGSKRDWSHIAKQIGMFAFSGLSEEEVKALREKSVYLNMDGRMSMTGVNSKNISYLAQAIHDVTK